MTSQEAVAKLKTMLDAQYEEVAKYVSKGDAWDCLCRLTNILDIIDEILAGVTD